MCKMNRIFSVLSCLGVVGFFTTVVGFPDGAPIEACIYKNYPNHPGTKPLSPNIFPYEFIASSDKFLPGQKIKVVLSGPKFKGFFVQARLGGPDGKWIGEFLQTPHTKNHPECSAITHSSPEFKNDMVFTWVAPPHHQGGFPGKVVFLGTVMAKYDAYWVNMIAKVQIPHGPPLGPPHGLPHGPPHGLPHGPLRGPPLGPLLI